MLSGVDDQFMKLLQRLDRHAIERQEDTSRLNAALSRRSVGILHDQSLCETTGTTLSLVEPAPH